MLSHFSPAYDKQEESVGFAMQQLEAKNKVLKICAMLLMGLLLKVAVQAAVHRLKRLLEVDHAMEPSLVRSSILVYDAGTFQCTQVHFVCKKIFWIQAEARLAYAKQEWSAYSFSSTKEGWFVSILQTDGDDQCHIFVPGGVSTMLGRAYGFP
ncbi:hypothetical protein GOP47_0030399, partial [Adiantum capillus-veneris]